MTFLPRTAEVRQEIWKILLAVPVSLIGTGFLFVMIEQFGRV